jgi:hypothetical protein
MERMATGKFPHLANHPELTTCRPCHFDLPTIPKIFFLQSLCHEPCRNKAYRNSAMTKQDGYALCDIFQLLIFGYDFSVAGYFRYKKCPYQPKENPPPVQLRCQPVVTTLLPCVT